MKDGTILLMKQPKDAPWYEQIIGRTIIFLTQSPFVHTLIYLNGYTYDWNMKKENGKWYSGVIKTKGIRKPYDTALEPNFNLTKKQIKKMEEYFEEASLKRYPYNVARLIILAIVYPTRWFWNLINWVPFSKVDKGEVCSSGIDEAFEYAGIDLIPNSEEELTVPGDFFKLVENGEFKEI